MRWDYTNVLVGKNLLEGFLIEATGVRLPVVDLPDGLQATGGGGSTLSKVAVMSIGDPANVGIEVEVGNFVLHDNDVGIGDGILLVVEVEHAARFDSGESGETDGQSLEESHGCK